MYASLRYHGNLITQADQEGAPRTRDIKDDQHL